MTVGVTAAATVAVLNIVRSVYGDGMIMIRRC